MNELQKLQAEIEAINAKLAASKSQRIECDAPALTRKYQYRQHTVIKVADLAEL